MQKTITTNIRYDGDALADHSIDIAILSKFLMALSALVKEANSLVNSNESEINIRVNANVEQNCFELSLTYIYSFIEATKDFFNHENVVPLKEILDWLGITPADIIVGTGVGFWYLIKNKKGRSISANEIIREDDNYIYLKDEKGNEIKVSWHVFNTYQQKTIRRHAQNFISPLNEKGIDNIGFYDNQDTEKSHTIHKSEVKDFLDYDIEKEEEIEEEELVKNETVKYIVIYKPTLDETTTTWSFLLNEKPVNIDISETDIVKDAVKRGGIGFDDTYKVKLEEEEYKTKKNQYKTRYNY